MRSVNKVILIGNVTRNPETRHTQGGQAVCTFGLATNREWVTADGRKKNSAEYHELVAWAQLADICQKYVNKGKLLYIEGYLKTRSWDTPEGIRKFKTEVVVKDMIMLEKKSDDSGEYVPTGEKFSSDSDYSMNDLGSVDEETSTEKDDTSNELDQSFLDDELGL
jgi:single-strand DNA-binding protein